MTFSQTRLSYQDCYDVLERAKDDPKGIRIRFEARSRAMSLRSRRNYARQIDRRDNSLIYEETDPLYGRSVYDLLTVRVMPENGNEAWWVYIEHTSIDHLEIESLSDLTPYEIVEETKKIE